MAIAERPIVFDLLDIECQHIYRCNDALEAMYYTCGATELAIEHLSKPHWIAQDFKVIIDQLRSMKSILDNHMKVVRLLFVNLSKCREELNALKDIDEPEIADVVKSMRNLLAKSCQEIRSYIKQVANNCVAFHLGNKLALDYLMEFYCKEIKSNVSAPKKS